MKFNQLIGFISDVSVFFENKTAKNISYYLNVRNWLIGWYIVEYKKKGEDRAEYGSKLLKKLSQGFKDRNQKGLSFTNLNIFRQFYQTYPQFAEIIKTKYEQIGITSIIQATELLSQNIGNKPNNKISQATDFLPEYNAELILDVDKLFSSLTFTHFTELIRIENPLKRLFYEIQSIKENWATRELERQIGSLLFERVGFSKNKKELIQKINQENARLLPTDIVKDPYILEFLNLPDSDILHETQLEQALIDNLQKFLLELGKGFCFIGRQYRIQIDNEFYYPDLVFYHRFLKCFVIIELKTRAFKHEDSSQLNMYLNYFKENETQEEENPPVGILLCTDKKENVVKYATAGMQNLFVSRYMTALPSQEELNNFIQKEKRHLGF